MEQNTQHTALLVMDMQIMILNNLANSAPLVSNCAKAIKYARENKIPVIYVTVRFRPGAPEISLNNKGFTARKESWTAEGIEELVKVEPSLTPKPDDIVVIKRRVSAFTGSDLEVVLRAQGIQQLILTGFATSGVVLSTLREAADKDYRITVISDCCADRDDEVHNILMTKVFPRQAEILTLEEWSK